jgi:hypothetical protein|tara:strand:- start:743 stop:1162 length:420 start_codon:yes stop_codon:yes gene_type:complete
MPETKYTQEFFDNSFFESRYLDRRLYADDINTLSPSEAKSLKTELERALDGINDKFAKEKDCEDYDWLHKISVKKEVVKVFLARIESYEPPSHVPFTIQYHLSFFRQLVAKRVGPLEADRLYEKARLLADSQTKKEFNL